MSITNAQLRWVKSLAKKSARVESGRFFAEGSQSLKVLARNPHWVETIYVTDDFAEENSELLSQFRPELLARVESEQIDRMADANSPQGVMAICKLPADDSDLIGEPIVFLEHISDPGNLGTIIRTADASGAGTVVVGTGSVDAFSPKVVRSSAGSIFNISIIQEVESEAVLSDLRRQGYKLFAADMNGEPFQEANLDKKHVWVFGNEAHGLSQAVLDFVDETFSIPIYGKAESLNLSVAAGVVLYHSAFSKRG